MNFHNFGTPALVFITEIYKVKHFQNNLEKKKLLRSGPFADPFIIAKAMIEKATIVTMEKFTRNGVRIPYLYRHFKIAFLNLEGFLNIENWVLKIHDHDGPPTECAAHGGL